MTLPYTPVQAAVRFVEEDGELAESLDGMPVVCCSLHSQVVPTAAGVGEGVRVSYVQLAGGALPVALSDSLRALKERGLVETAIASGASVGGDVQAVGVASALAWAAAQGFDLAICSIGPGIVGTGSPLGHGGLAAAEAANAASALGGSPVLAVRVSERDARERHRGVSHHTRAVLDLAIGRREVAWPTGLETPDSGQVLIGDEDVTAQPARERGVGMVFQHYAAFKHMTVYDNVAFGLKIRGKGNGMIRERVEQLLDGQSSCRAAQIRDVAARRQQSHHCGEERRLAGAVGPDDADDRSRRHRQRHIVHGLDLAIGDMDMCEFEERRHRFFQTPPR